MTDLEKNLGYIFNSARLLQEALTHSSFAYETNKRVHNNERLEFLGDAVLQLVASDLLYEQTPALSEGVMTSLRARLVCESTLDKIARQLGLPAALLMGHGERLSGGAGKASNLSDALEAVFGAIYLDSDLESVRPVIVNLLQPWLQQALQGKLIYDYKSYLLEQAQKFGHRIHFVIVNAAGPDHARVFTAAVLQENEELARGSGSTKKEAEQQAAKSVLEEREILQAWEIGGSC